MAKVLPRQFFRPHGLGKSTPFQQATFFHHSYAIRTMASAAKAGDSKGTAIVLLNMGGPSKVKETYDFLARLFVGLPSVSRGFVDGLYRRIGT